MRDTGVSPSCEFKRDVQHATKCLTFFEKKMPDIQIVGSVHISSRKSRSRLATGRFIWHDVGVTFGVVLVTDLPCTSDEGKCGIKSKAAHIFNLGTGLLWVVSFTLRPLYPRRKGPPVRVEWRDWVGPSVSQSRYICEVGGFRRGVDEVFAVLGFYAAYVASCLLDVSGKPISTIFKG
jgi:hypothetical protein